MLHHSQKKTRKKRKKVLLLRLHLVMAEAEAEEVGTEGAKYLLVYLVVLATRAPLVLVLVLPLVFSWKLV